jgi:hypothetical protein
MLNWTAWKRFPDPQRGESIEAPIGPGVYEVRDIASGDLIAFDHTDSVARALASLRKPPPRTWLFRRRHANGIELEYRTCAATSHSDAKVMVEQLRRQLQAYWRNTGQTGA